MNATLDGEFLARSVQRHTALGTVAEEPNHRTQRRVSSGASSFAAGVLDGRRGEATRTNHHAGTMREPAGIGRHGSGYV